LFPSILLLLAVSADEPSEWAQLTIEQRVIMRVPMMKKGKAPPRVAPDGRDEWHEKKGPRCIALKSIKGASIIVAQGVDLILSDNHRYRARLERGCSAADFYSGFYVEPNDDGSLCSGRDELQARGGLSCGIESFKRLVAPDPDE